MSMLLSQCDKLVSMAQDLRELSNGQVNQGFPARAMLLEAADMMREAADTIERLRKQVAKCQIAELKADYDTSRYFELFGTPERAARTLVDSCNDDTNYGCSGCPLVHMDCKYGNYDALLEWLRGDAE